MDDQSSISSPLDLVWGFDVSPDAFAMRMAKLKCLGDKWATQGAGKKEEEQRLQQERAIMEAAMKKEAADSERDRTDKLNKLMAKKKMAEENLRISKLHQQEAQQAKEAEKKEIDRFKELERENQAQQVKEKMKHRAQQRGYSSFLQAQIQLSQRTKHEPDISERERLLNKHVLEAAQSDPQFQAVVETKLLPSLEGSATKRKTTRRQSSYS